MPGYANWEKLYKQELFQMKEEGYDLTNAPVLTKDGSGILPFPGIDPEKDTDAEKWEKAYRKLEEIMKNPLRADFPFVEPNGFEEILQSAKRAPKLISLSEEEYEKRLKGAVYGRIVGIILGKPLEMAMTADEVREYLTDVDAYPLTDYVPAGIDRNGREIRPDCLPSTRGSVQYAQADDDIHYTLLALLLAEQKGYGFTSYDVGKNWLSNVPYRWFWCASRQAYYHMVNDDPVEEIPTSLNPWRECIDGQIRCDLWGYIAPSDLKKAAYGAYKDCAFSLTKNGIYGGMFVAGCLAGALSADPTVDRIIDSGLAVIPKTSRLAKTVNDVRRWYKKSGDFDYTCRMIYKKVGHLPVADTINNIAAVVLAMLEGNMDYSKTVAAACYCGLDTDCNAGTAGSIIGAAVGFDGIDPKWYEPLNDTVKTNVAAIGQTTITAIVERISQLHKKLENVEV